MRIDRFFAGIWTTWRGKRGTKANPIEGEHQLFGFLTTDANAEVGAIHPKAMPVILTQTDQVEAWLTLPIAEALQMQKPLPDGALKIVARGEKEDGALPELASAEPRSNLHQAAEPALALAFNVQEATRKLAK
jgi:putative SOS response-associated peptidase YedK